MHFYSIWFLQSAQEGIVDEALEPVVTPTTETTQEGFVDEALDPLATLTIESTPVAIVSTKRTDEVKDQVTSQGSTPSLSQLPSYIDSLCVQEQDLNQSDG